MSVLDSTTQKTIEEAMIRDGLITLDELNKVKETAKQNKTPLITELIKEKKISTEDFIIIAEIENEIRLKHIIEIGNKPTFKNNSTPIEHINFQSKAQPSFNRQFELLINNLQEYEKLKYNIFIFSLCIRRF